MKSITQIKSLGDTKTGISAHVRSAPRREGSTFLEVFLLDKERQRLEMEMAMLNKRQRRIMGRLAEIRDEVDKRIGQSASGEPLAARLSADGSASDRVAPKRGQWRQMTIEY